MTFMSNKNLMDIVLQDENNRPVNSYFAQFNSHLNAIFQDLLIVLKDAECSHIHIQVHNST